MKNLHWPSLRIATLILLVVTTVFGILRAVLRALGSRSEASISFGLLAPVPYAANIRADHAELMIQATEVLVRRI